MVRILAIRVNRDECGDPLERLGREGHRIDVLETLDADALRRIRNDPPDVFLLDLSRSPALARDAAAWLRSRKATRNVPLVFVGGAERTVEQVKSIFPDATYTGGSRVRGALRRALTRRPAEPVSPGVFAGYAGTPLPKKLGIRAGSRVRLVEAPGGFEGALGELPRGARTSRRGRSPARVVILFCRNAAVLHRNFETAARTVEENGVLWIVWPKKASSVKTDLGASAVRAYGLSRRWVDYKICAIDSTWSGLAFARRRQSP